MSEDLNDLASSILDAIAAKVPSIDVDGLGPDLARALRRQGVVRREAPSRRAIVQEAGPSPGTSRVAVPANDQPDSACAKQTEINRSGPAWSPDRRPLGRPRYQRVPFRG